MHRLFRLAEYERNIQIVSRKANLILLIPAIYPRTYRAQITPDCGSKTVLFIDRETWRNRSNNFCLQKHSLFCSVLNLYALYKYMQISGSVVSAQSFRLGFPKTTQALVSDFQTRDSASFIFYKIKPVSSIKIQTAEYPAMLLHLIKQWHKIPCS